MSRSPLPWRAFISVPLLSWRQTFYALNTVLSFSQRLRERGSAELISPVVCLEGVLIGTLLVEVTGSQTFYGLIGRFLQGNQCVEANASGWATVSSLHLAQLFTCPFLASHYQDCGQSGGKPGTQSEPAGWQIRRSGCLPSFG